MIQFKKIIFLIHKKIKYQIKVKINKDKNTQKLLIIINEMDNLMSTLFPQIVKKREKILLMA
jgi:hypothetical protein